MTYPTTFANLAAGTQPLSLFDTMFQVVGQQGAIPCTAAGTNTITLTPNTNYYAPTVLTNGLIVSFEAINTTTAAATVQLLSLGVLNVYTALGSQVGAEDITAGSHYILQYWSDLNSSAGGWLILNSNGSRVGYGPAGLGIGGAVTQTTSRATTVTVNTMCGAITLFTASGVTAINHFTVSNSLVGANDLIVLNAKTAPVSRYTVTVSVVATGSFDINYAAVAAATTADSPVINFAVIKSVIT